MSDPMAVEKKRRMTVAVVFAVLLVLLLAGIAVALSPSLNRDDDFFFTLLSLVLFTGAALGCLPAWRSRRWRVAVVLA